MNKGDKIKLSNQDVEIIGCESCEHLMVNLDANQLAQGDLVILKKAGIRISNPETEKPICINCEYKTIGRKLADWFEEDNDDDSGFFSTGGFIGGASLGGFGGGFGGFGGGSFGGGGVSRGF